MRVIGGIYKSRVLVEFSGMDVRPTSDRAKEALFNILAFSIRGARVLDLFAGSGSLGIEAISRGASEVVFNDVAKESVAIIKKNLQALKIPLSNQIKVYNYDYSTCLDAVQGQFDFVFIDPPYKLEIGKLALQKIAKKGLLSANGIIAYERDIPFEGEIDGLEKYDERKYGKAYITFFRKMREE